MDCSHAHFSRPQFTYLQNGERDTSFPALLWALGSTHIWGLHKGLGEKRPAPLCLTYRETEASKDPQKTNLSLAWSPVPGWTYPPAQTLSPDGLLQAVLARTVPVHTHGQLPGKRKRCPVPALPELVSQLFAQVPERLPRCSITHTIPGTQCSWPSTGSFT